MELTPAEGNPIPVYLFVIWHRGMPEAERLLGEIPEGIVRVAESGVRTRADIERLAAAGADAFLVGTTLMKSSDPVRQLRSLTGTLPG